MRNGRISGMGAVAGPTVLHLLLAGILALSGCESASEVIGPEPALPRDSSASNAAANGQLNPARLLRAIPALAIGGGQFFNDAFGVPVQFAFAAVQRHPSGEAFGTYHFSASADGLAILIHGRITCMTTDPENPSRAWMGGKITKNQSEHPVFTGETSRVGRDAWFRVVDYGHGAHAPQADRTSMIFFEPAGGFTSAAEFCEGQLWFPDDRLTNALLHGNILVTN